ncbi:DUF2628 domain-containing protein [Rufibacter immobilis]|uniref:DUF2628 domain-containing protein n=1 Tax=Rufibacter immobilis TaxID=1348778 RepID=UPI0035ED8E21
MQPHAPQPEPDDTDDYFHAYFGADAEYYMDRLEQYRQGRKLMFNWGAFFFGIAWMLYRKLYKEALLAMATIVVLSFLVERLIQTAGLTGGAALLANNAFTIGWSLLLGFIGNWLYLRQAHVQVQKVLAQAPGQQAAFAQLQQLGGITFIPHIIVAALIAVLLLLTQFSR